MREIEGDKRGCAIMLVYVCVDPLLYDSCMSLLPVMAAVLVQSCVVQLFSLKEYRILQAFV